jgi:hypothetical protein
MKRFLLAALVIPSAILAQPPFANPRPQGFNSQTPGVALADNYQVTLTLTDKNDPPLEVSVVVASSQFTAVHGEQHLNFNGSVTVEESGAIVVAYSLGWQTPVPAGNGNIQSSTQGSVRLKLGEEVQIIRAGTRIARLSIKKLDASKPK